MTFLLISSCSRSFLACLSCKILPKTLKLFHKIRNEVHFINWEDAESANFTWDEISALRHFELTTKQLNEICDQLTRDELTVPRDMAIELGSIFSGFEALKSMVIKTLPDFIHIAGIFCTLYLNTQEGNSVLPKLVIAADALLQFYQSKK